MDNRTPTRDLEGLDLSHAVVDVDIRPDGTVRFQVSGLPGSDCERLEDVLRRILQGEVVEREHTPEFYQTVRRGVGARLEAFLRRK